MLERSLGHKGSLFWIAVNMFLDIEKPYSRKFCLKESGGNKEIQALLSVPLLFFCRNGFPSGSTAPEALILIG